MQVRRGEAGDASAVRAFLEEHGSLRVARLGRLLETTVHEHLLTEVAGGLAGVLTLRVDGSDAEVLTLHAAAPWRGVGSALVEAAADAARDRGCSRLWLVTTNDNVDALRFYQRRGFRLVALHAGAVDESRRRLKPEIPPVGAHGIGLHDEIVLQRPLRSVPTVRSGEAAALGPGQARRTRGSSTA